MFVQCHPHPVDCIYIYTLSPKHAFTPLLTGCRHSISSEVTVNKVNSWKHLYLISAQSRGLANAGLPWSRLTACWFTTAAQASLRKPFFFFPLWDYTMFRLNPTHMSPGAIHSSSPSEVASPWWREAFSSPAREDILDITKARAMWPFFLNPGNK